MNMNTINGDIICTFLRQMGAESIKEFNSTMHIAEFNLGDGMLVSYVFNITYKDKYFLQRMRPYAMVHGKFATDKEIEKFIKEDITRFRNAKKSSNFNTFIQACEKSNRLAEEMENIFLNYNVDKETLEEIEVGLSQIMTIVDKLHNNSTKIKLDIDSEFSKSKS